jgi:soluble lytic murein transglycosylase-like protein
LNADLQQLWQRHTKRILIAFHALLFVFPAPLNLTGAVRLQPAWLFSRSRSAGEAIVKWSRYYNVDTDLAIRIAEAESGVDCKVQNKDSSAGGLFQFTNATFVETQKRLGKHQDLSRKFDCDENAELAVYLLSKKEFHRWDASRSAWDAAGD